MSSHHHYCFSQGLPYKKNQHFQRWRRAVFLIFFLLLVIGNSTTRQMCLFTLTKKWQRMLWRRLVFTQLRWFMTDWCVRLRVVQVLSVRVGKASSGVGFENGATIMDTFGRIKSFRVSKRHFQNGISVVVNPFHQFKGGVKFRVSLFEPRRWKTN